MRLRLVCRVAAAGLLVGLAAMAEEPRGPAAVDASVEGALEEPADPDDAADIRADDDPDDVGQEALPPAQQPAPDSEATPDPAPPDGGVDSE